MSINQCHKCSNSTSCICQHTPCTSDFHFSVANVAGFSSLCPNEFWTLIVCILTFGPLRKSTKPQDIRSHRIKSYLYGRMPKNVVLVSILIITQNNREIQKGTLYPAPETPGWYREGLNHLKKLWVTACLCCSGLGATIFAQKEFISWHELDESLDTRQAHHHDLSHPGSLRNQQKAGEHLCHVSALSSHIFEIFSR